MPKVYLSGPMSGLPKYNYPAFYEAAMRLRLKGVEVLSPAEGTVTHDKMWSDYMRRAIKMLCDCDYNVRLPGWANSTGARLETQIADALGIINIDLDEMLESLQPDEMEASK